MKNISILLGILAIQTAVYASSNPLNPNQDKPTRVYVENYTESDDSKTADGWDGYDSDGVDQYWLRAKSTGHDDENWSDGSGGSGSQMESGHDESSFYGTPENADTQCSVHFSWPAASWPAALLINGTESAAGDCNWESLDTNGPWGPPNITWEHCDIHPPATDETWGPSPYYALEEYGWDNTDYKRKADAKIKLQTGGKGQSSRQNLFCISGSAVQVIITNTPYTYQSIPAQNIKITGTSKTLGSDGNLYVVEHDNTEVDITPQVSGMDYYTFNVTAQKYTLTLTANGNDLSVINPEFCVGQNVTFSPSWDSNPGAVDTTAHWHLPGDYKNESYAYSSTCTSYRLNSDLLTNLSTSCWYVNKPGGACSMFEILHFSNGQYASIAAKGSFTVYRPTISLEPLTTAPYYTLTTNIVGLYSFLKLGKNDESGDGEMQFTVDINSKYGGTIGLTQLITANYSNPLYVFSTERCDGSEFYDGPWTVTGTTDFSAPSGLTSLDDGPSEYWVDPNIVSLSARDFARFQPSGGIPVTLGIVTWETVGVANDLFGVWSITTDATTGPTGPNNSDEFPVWNANQGGMH